MCEVESVARTYFEAVRRHAQAVRGCEEEMAEIRTNGVPFGGAREHVAGGAVGDPVYGQYVAVQARLDALRSRRDAEQAQVDAAADVLQWLRSTVGAKAEAVELRYVRCMCVAEAALVLGVDGRTVKRWTAAAFEALDASPAARVLALIM